MNIIETKLYSYDELSSKAKTRAIDYFRYSDIQSNTLYDCIYYTASKCGIDIVSFDLEQNKIDIVNKIEWIAIAKELDIESKALDIESKAKEYFLNLLIDEYKYNTSDEHWIEHFRDNEYLFLEDGTYYDK